MTKGCKIDSFLVTAKYNYNIISVFKETTSTEATKEINHLQVRLDRIVEEKKRVEGELLRYQPSD